MRERAGGRPPYKARRPLVSRIRFAPAATPPSTLLTHAQHGADDGMEVHLLVRGGRHWCAARGVGARAGRGGEGAPPKQSERNTPPPTPHSREQPLPVRLLRLGNTLTFFHRKHTQTGAMFRAFYFVATLALACQVRERE